MMKQLILSPSSVVLILIMFFLLICTITSGQPSAPAASPSGSSVSSGSSSGPPDITAILKKAGKFTTFIGLLKSTQVDDLINNQLKSNLGFTVFAPTDTAFSDLQSGTLNSYTDEQKTSLTKFHIVPSFLTISQFQTVSNPVNTVAGDSAAFPLDVVSNGTQVNITTAGLVNTTVDSTVYSDGQLAVYEIPDVLLAQGIVNPLAEAPLSPKPEKASAPTAYAPSKSTGASAASSDAPSLSHYSPAIASIGVTVLAAVRLCL